MNLHRVRRVSSALFGHRYRLELLIALVAAGDEGVCVRDLATSHGVASSVFYPPLHSLVDLGLARRMPPRQDRRVFYTMTGARAWTGLRQVVQDLPMGDGDKGAAS